MLIAGFGFYAVGPPDVPLGLHEARATGDEMATEVWETRWRRDQLRYRWTTFALFGGSACMVVVAYLAMRGKDVK